jgi:predicted CXXCH cytochrome family protein
VLGRRLRRWALALAGVALTAVLFLTALTAKERDNRFCIACHLHEEKFERFVGAPSLDLAGFHYAKKAEIGCIRCHGGADATMRARVWAGAARDTVKFLLRSYEEPAGMRLPLRDAECRQCHDPIEPPSPRTGSGAVSPSPAAPGAPGVDDPNLMASYAAVPEAEGAAATSYHGIREHGSVRVPCVRCHTSHTSDGGAGNRFISRSTVQPICRECHKHL